MTSLRLLRATALLLSALVPLSCGDDSAGDDDDDDTSPDAAVVEHLRVCGERCDDQIRCSERAPTAEACAARCEAMAEDAACRALHADFFECLSFVSCVRYDDAISTLCGEELRALALGCPAWIE